MKNVITSLLFNGPERKIEVQFADKFNNTEMDSSILIEHLKETELPKEEKGNNSLPNYGWTCPVCGRGNSPFTGTCPCQPYPVPIIT